MAFTIRILKNKEIEDLKIFQVLNNVVVFDRNTFSKIHNSRKTLSPFEIKKGQKKGDALSPTLFNLALERVIEETLNNKGMDIIGNITLLAYTDDIVVFGESKTDSISSTIDFLEKNKKI